MNFLPHAKLHDLKDASLSQNHQKPNPFFCESTDEEDWMREEKPANKEIEPDARRVAAAFGIEAFGFYWDKSDWYYQGYSHGVLVSWILDERSGELCLVAVGEGSKQCVVSREREFNWGRPPWGDAWEFEPLPRYHSLMARGLYLLNFESTPILDQLNAPLSHHEQIQCRLEMPREFWPANWMEHTNKE